MLRAPLRLLNGPIGSFFLKDCPWRSVKCKVVDPRKGARSLISAEVRGIPEEMAKRYGL